LDPHTASNAERKYVSLTLDIAFHKDYPSRAPAVQVRSPRGLRETCVVQLLAQLRQRAEEFAVDACPVAFELVEMAREFLTARNEVPYMHDNLKSFT